MSPEKAGLEVMDALANNTHKVMVGLMAENERLIAENKRLRGRIAYYESRKKRFNLIDLGG